MPNTTEQYARGLIILSMPGGTIPNMVQDNMGALLAHGLGQRGRDDPLLAKYACPTLRVSSNLLRTPETTRVQWHCLTLWACYVSIFCVR